MDAKQVNPITIIVAIVIVVVLFGYFGFRSLQPASPRAGSYTPGVPPWLDKSHSNSAPGVHAPPQAGQPSNG